MARKLVMVGAAYLNGSRCRIASKPVFKVRTKKVEYNPEKLRPIQLEFPSLSQKDILYNEGGLIVVNKPANMPTVATLDNARQSGGYAQDISRKKSYQYISVSPPA